MLFKDHLILFRGGGDLATGVAYRLHHAGFPVIVTELAVRVESPEDAWTLAHTGVIPVLVAPDPGTFLNLSLVTRNSSLILVDARMAKRNIDTTIGQAPLVIALGPGFIAGTDCHAVIETNRGHRLGRVIWRGAAEPNTGTPGIVAGKGRERVLRAPVAGTVSWQVTIGNRVRAEEIMGDVAGHAIAAPFDGVVRGLIAPGTIVPVGLKIGDVDPRDDVSAAFTISDKALAIGGGVLEAVLIHVNQQERHSE
ncbi:MAG: EF2563 family selenium-dependent molybdenum hydroxylase system protein [Anaerolineae bacterium]|nr:MAG: EF2563 family selenium-dependent molybdenum hydroxylase system protein [Anaerolineae bacterium]